MQNLLSYNLELLISNQLFMLGFILFFGYIIGKGVARIHIPEITGFIVAGVILNAGSTDLMSGELNHLLHLVTEVAIGLLALSIGSEFSMKKIRSVGREALIITGVQFVVTFFVVYFALTLFGLAPPFAIILAVTACATAPAVIAAEVHHLRAYGSFVDYLFGTVILIDAFCVVLFGVAFTLVTNHMDFSGTVDSVLVNSFAEIIFSLVIGLVSGVLLHLVTQRNRNSNEMQIITLSIVAITTGVSVVFHFSPLLVNITAGIVLASFSTKNHRLIKSLEPLTPPIYALFFIIAGLEMHPSVFSDPLTLGLAAVYVGFRLLGKYFGVYAGCSLAGTSSRVRNNLGFCMASQAGVALGFVLLIQTSPVLANLPDDSSEKRLFLMMSNIVLISIFVNELFGPVLSRYGIIRGNEMEE